jgi:hypothetical protein
MATTKKSQTKKITKKTAKKTSSTGLGQYTEFEKTGVLLFLLLAISFLLLALTRYM